jgi:predicted O-methyltransferase YrrM
MNDRARRMAVELVRRGADRLGFDLVYRNYYSPIPDLRALPADTWTRASELPGIVFSAEEQLAHLAAIADHADELDATGRAAAMAPAFTPDNGSYSGPDAAILYLTLRALRPRRVIEIGAGYSTLVSAAALAVNREQGAPAHFVSVDPFAPAMLDGAIAGLDELRRVTPQAMGIDELLALESGDVLFIDSTHTVKPGSEVNLLVLEVLPRLAPGVVVHVHDVFLPWEYPRHWIAEHAYYWSEQYLLQAFLAENARWRVLLANHWLCRAHGPEVERLIPTPADPDRAAGIWLRAQ